MNDIKPIDMVLFCPACGMQHVDAPEYEDDPTMLASGITHKTFDGWTNPPHRTHLCHHCGFRWRPADVPTNGVLAVKTKGEKDSPLARDNLSRLVGAAKRYFWLRDISAPPHNFYISVPDEFKDQRYTAQEVDDAIDAAMAALDKSRVQPFKPVESTAKTPVSTDATSIRIDLLGIAQNPNVSDRDRIVLGAAIGLLSPETMGASQQAEIDRVRHVSNEWADMATNGLQWLRNIAEGISTIEEALPNMESCLRHCREVRDAASTAARGQNQRVPSPIEHGKPPQQSFGIIDPDYARIFTQARIIAWQYGWACLAHGSFTRDLDLLFVPWEDRAMMEDPEHLIRRVADVTGLEIARHPPTDKPHGRQAWTLHLPGFTEPRWVDISIFGAKRSENDKTVEQADREQPST